MPCKLVYLVCTHAHIHIKRKKYQTMKQRAFLCFLCKDFMVAHNIYSMSAAGVITFFSKCSVFAKAHKRPNNCKQFVKGTRYLFKLVELLFIPVFCADWTCQHLTNRMSADSFLCVQFPFRHWQRIMKLLNNVSFICKDGLSYIYILMHIMYNDCMNCVSYFRYCSVTIRFLL